MPSLNTVEDTADKRIIMPRVDMTIEKTYLNAHPKAGWDIYLWTSFADMTDEAFRLAFAFRDWLQTDRSTVPPDLVGYIALYGYIRLRLKVWELPIRLNPQEMEQWRTAGYYVSREDFHEPIARIAGGFLKLAGTDPQLTASIIQQQLDEKLAELERLADLPVDEHYTPRWQEWQIRKSLRDTGFTGKALDDAVEEEQLEDPHLFERKEWEKPFDLRQQLESFEWGMECLRMIVLGENAPELGLPNKPLFDALMQINLNGLIAQLEDVDVKLRRIWQNLAKYRCYCLNADYEPKRFWWRHWQQQAGRGASHNRK